MDHHSLKHLLVFLIIGGVIGLLAGIITRGRGFGIIGDIAVGVMGAIFGGWVASELGWSITTTAGEFLWAILGAVVLVGLTRFVVRNVGGASQA